MTGLATWIAFKSWSKKLWAWCKKNWKFFVGLAIPIILLIFFRKRLDSKITERIQEDYKKELEIIENSKKEQLKELNESQNEYIKKIKEIRENYEKDKAHLNKEQQKRIEELLENNEKDPETITKEIAWLMKFKIHGQDNE